MDMNDKKGSLSLENKGDGPVSPPPSSKSEEFQVVSKIEMGIVIDHIISPKAFLLARILHLEELAGKNPEVEISMGVGLSSRRLGCKDVIKIARWNLLPAQLQLISLVSPRATVNVIEHYKVVSKSDVNPPPEVGDIINCPDHTCITNHERIAGKFKLLKDKPLTLQCHYCETVFYDRLIKFK